jgi:hypothetical protein
MHAHRFFLEAWPGNTYIIIFLYHTMVFNKQPVLVVAVFTFFTLLLISCGKFRSARSKSPPQHRNFLGSTWYIYHHHQVHPLQKFCDCRCRWGGAARIRRREGRRRLGRHLLPGLDLQGLLAPWPTAGRRAAAAPPRSCASSGRQMAMGTRRARRRLKWSGYRFW